MDEDDNIDFDPFNNYDHLCECLVFFVNRTWTLRGQNEPGNLLLTDLNFSTSRTGRNSIELKNLRGRKNGKLTLDNTSFTIGFENAIDEDTENKYCVYKIMHYHKINHLPENYSGKFFMQKASKKELEERKSVGDFREASTTKAFTNYTFERYTKSLARKCKFNNPEK